MYIHVNLDAFVLLTTEFQVAFYFFLRELCRIPGFLWWRISLGSSFFAGENLFYLQDLVCISAV